MDGCRDFLCTPSSFLGAGGGVMGANRATPDWTRILIFGVDGAGRQMRSIVVRVSYIILALVCVNLGIRAQPLPSKIISLFLGFLCVVFLLCNLFEARIVSAKCFSRIGRDNIDSIGDILFFCILISGGFVVLIATYTVHIESLILKIFFYVLASGGIALCLCHIILRIDKLRKGKDEVT
jgi:hypothetical protein